MRICTKSRGHGDIRNEILNEIKVFNVNSAYYMDFVGTHANVDSSSQAAWTSAEGFRSESLVGQGMARQKDDTKLARRQKAGGEQPLT
ncbi:hypothetical protein EVAR_102428_1 [Eumeta japonica]|uniref:Uncharacterized protein n=1 Tax=Eumeta variegata TaxID=151549 RepID=A0A4C1YWJ1_EUMVA|nr:hypothetical protein EVAR_102428_1 [Eumeta japonica]